MKDDRLISINAAIDALNGLTEIYLNNLPPTIYKGDAIIAIKALPSAQPGWSEQYKNKQSNCKKMPLPKPWEGEQND